MTRTLLLFLMVQLLHAQPRLENVSSGTAASLRGLCAVSDEVCWSSGSHGTVIRTIDGGNSWTECSPPGYSSLQFRDIHAFNKDTALILSAGLPAVILKTVDGGNSWKEVYENTSEGVFFDAFDFWDQKEGLAFSDAAEKHLLILKTTDGGDSWQEIPQSILPEVGFRQGGFAASGSCLKTFGENSVIIGLGGASPTTLLSEDRGISWKKSTVPLDSGSSSKGIFSFCFRNAYEGICVGGDYTGDSATTRSAAMTTDGGHSWKLITDPAINGSYRSCVICLNEDTVVAVSHTGISYSLDGGKNWDTMNGSFYSASTGEELVWLSGPEGGMAKLHLK